MENSWRLHYSTHMESMVPFERIFRDLGLSEQDRGKFKIIKQCLQEIVSLAISTDAPNSLLNNGYAKSGIWTGDQLCIKIDSTPRVRAIAR